MSSSASKQQQQQKSHLPKRIMTTSIRSTTTNQDNRNKRNILNFTNFEKLPPIVSNDQNTENNSLTVIDEYLHKTIEDVHVSSSVNKTPSQMSTISHQSLFTRRSMGCNKKDTTYQLKEIILPKHKRITKEDLFSTKSSSTCTDVSSPVPPSLTNISNIGNYDSDSPLGIEDASSNNITNKPPTEGVENGGMGGREGGKTFFPACFRRSISQQLVPVSNILNENTVSLFTPENLKLHNNKGLDKSVNGHNIELQKSFSKKYITAIPGNNMLLHEKFIQQENKEKVSDWLCRATPEELKMSAGTTNNGYRGNFRNSNSINSKDLAKSF